MTIFTPINLIPTVMERKSIELDGLQLSYLEKNTNKNTCLLLIHGNSLNAKLFTSLFKHSAFDNYRIVAPDLPGHGKSERSSTPEKHYPVTGLLSILNSFIDELKLDNIHLFGHSLGGHLGISLLKTFGDKINQIVMLGTPPVSSLADLALAFNPKPAMQYAYSENLTSEQVEELASSFGKEEFKPEISDTIKNADPKFRSTFGQTLPTIDYPNEVELLKNFKKDVLIMHGELDDLVNINYLQKLPLTNLFDNGIKIIKNGSHSCFLDKTDEFVKVIGDYFKF